VSKNKKIFHFSYPISGECDLQIEANTPEEALKRFNEGKYRVEINDWDVDFRWDYNPTVEDLMKHCSNKSDFKQKDEAKCE